MQEIKELEHILEKLIQVYGYLFELMNIEYEQMASLDVKGILESTQSKEVYLSEIFTLENLRAEVVRKILPKLGFNSNEEPSLTEIFSKLTPENQKSLSLKKDTLNLSINRVKELNDRNMGFVSTSLDKIETFKKNALGLNNNVIRENYGQAGNIQVVADQGGRLISTEA